MPNVVMCASVSPAAHHNPTILAWQLPGDSHSCMSRAELSTKIEKAVTWGSAFHAISYKFIHNALKPLFHGTSRGPRERTLEYGRKDHCAMILC